MDWRFGIEAQKGLGGGTVSRISQINLEKAEDLCRRGQPEKSVPYLQKALQDLNNLDAVIQMAFLTHRPEGIETLEQGENIGKLLLRKRLGEKAFDDDGPCVGKFWDILATRPYMRLRQALTRLYWEEGRYKECAENIAEMLRLCPGDNLGQRDTLGSLLLRVGRYEDALSFAQDWIQCQLTSGGLCPGGGVRFHQPSRDVMSRKKETRLLKISQFHFFYTAAFASFKLFGPTEQAEQYLRIATRLNPIVLTKILASIRRPSGLNNSPRQANGPENAHDYLYYTQDLWEQDDVLTWARNNPSVKEVLLKTCSRGGCPVKEAEIAQFKRCSACHLVHYCSEDCQRLDWETHKPACQEHLERKAMLRSIMSKRTLVGEDTMAVDQSMIEGEEIRTLTAGSAKKGPA